MLQRNADAEGSKIEMTEEPLEEFESVRAVEEFEAKERARQMPDVKKRWQNIKDERQSTHYGKKVNDSTKIWAI